MTDMIEKKWEMFNKLSKKSGEARAESISKMLEELGERIVMCPARDKVTHTTSKPGGLIENSLNVFKNIRSLNDMTDWNLSLESMIIVSLFHSLGKIGDLSGNSLFLVQDSDWHREKLGQVYKYNPDISRTTWSHQSLIILQSHDIKLSNDEWVSIMLSGGPAFEENKFYIGHEPRLAILLQQAIRLVESQEKL